MSQYTFIVSLGIKHPSQNLTETYQVLSAISGIRPGRLCNIGEERRTVDGKPLKGFYDESWCGFGFMDKWQDSDEVELPDAIDTIIDKILPHKNLLLELTSTGGTVHLSIGWGIDANSGTILDRQLLSRLVELGIELWFDLYPPDGNKQNTSEIGNEEYENSVSSVDHD